MNKYRHLLGLFLIFLTGLLLYSCKSKPVDPIEEYRNSLTTADTTIVLSMAQECMGFLKSGDFDLFVSNLSTVDSTGVVSTLSTEKVKRLQRNFAIFNVSDFVLSDFIFDTPQSNPITFKVQFGYDEATGTPMYTKFALNAVKTDSKWIISVK